MKLLKFSMLALLILVTCAFNACSTTGSPTDTQKIETACATATTAIQALTIANQEGKLTEQQKIAVINAMGVTTPICTAEEPPTMDAVKMQAFNRAVELLRVRMDQL